MEFVSLRGQIDFTSSTNKYHVAMMNVEISLLKFKNHIGPDNEPY